MPAERAVFVLICSLLTASALPCTAQSVPRSTAPSAPQSTVPTGPAERAPAAAETAAGSPRFDDPFDAYEAGAWDEALRGFLEQQTERPDDPAAALRVGSTRYQKGELDEAGRVLGSVAAKASPALREKALYNLGNTAYRQGQLDDAVKLYRRALEIDPDDEDAKFNLEFVQREIERRKKEQQKQQQQEDKNDPQDSRQQKNEEQDQNSPEPKKPQPGSSNKTGANGPDQDHDGLPDKTEREAENPTDPANPDTDGDGLQDGAEDLNANGRVDPHETDPNRRDSDGDGIPDGQEAPGEAAGSPDKPTEDLSEEEALRYLMALQEGRPERKPPDARAARAGRPAKDW